MTLRSGSSTIAKVRRGAGEIIKIYKGSDLLLAQGGSGSGEALPPGELLNSSPAAFAERFGTPTLQQPTPAVLLMTASAPGDICRQVITGLTAGSTYRITGVLGASANEKATLVIGGGASAAFEARALSGGALDATFVVPGPVLAVSVDLKVLDSLTGWGAAGETATFANLSLRKV